MKKVSYGLWIDSFIREVELKEIAQMAIDFKQRAVVY